MLKKVIVIGNGGHASSVIDLLHRLNYQVIGTIKQSGTDDNHICGVPTIGSDYELPEIRENVEFAFNGIGQIKSPINRMRAYENLLKLEFKAPPLIAPDAYVSKFSLIQDWTTIHAKCFVNAEVSIGKNSIINSGTIVEHGVCIGNHSHISTSVTVNGNAKIGNCCFVGSGSIIYQGAVIPDNTIIKSGSIIER